MTTVLHLSSSARGEDSATRSLGDALATGLAGDAGTIVERHLTDAVPLLTDEIGNNLASPEGTADSQGVLTFSDQLIAELDAADVLVIGCPLYNFGPPAALKAWADLVARGGRTFEYGESGPAGTLRDRPAYIVAASGGAPIGSPMDFATPWLTTFLGFLGITSVQTIAASSIMSDPEAIIAAAHAEVQQLVAG
ncbi:MAG: NAD(P)H-dependent oxidoreductase [Actinomycetota bacterium]